MFVRMGSVFIMITKPQIKYACHPLLRELHVVFVLSCSFNDACVAGSCVEGYEGFSCTTCTDGRVLTSSFQCENCLPIELQSTLLVFVFGISFVLLYYFVKDVRKENSPFSPPLKIGINFIQFNAIALAFAFDWQAAFADLLTAEDAVMSFGTAYLQLGCLTRGNTQPFVAETLVFLLFLPLVLVLLWIVGKALGHPNMAKTTGAVICFLLQPTLTQRAMLVFSCVRLGNGPDDFFLMQDLDLRCWSSEHAVLVALLGVPMLCVYVLGIPAGFFLLLRQKSKQDKDQFDQNYRWIWLGYQDQYLYWEVVIMLRKSFLTMAAVFFSFNYHAQARFGLMIVIAAGFVHARAFPFQTRVLNLLELLSLVCTSITFFCGQFTVIDLGYGQATVAAMSYIAFTITVLFSLVFLATFVQLVIAEKTKEDALEQAGVNHCCLGHV